MISAILNKILKFTISIVIFFIGTSILAVILYKYVEVPFTPLMGIRMIEQVHDGRIPHAYHEWVPLDSMSQYMPVAVIASEDQRFLSHNGFDVEAIERILKKKYEEGGLDAVRHGKMRGGSTITQQTAKNVFLWPTSSRVRKGYEAYFTVLIEAFWSKHRIMEVYLNVIEMGDGIYGTESVANKHFATSAHLLSRDQCAMIAASLPNPLKMDSSKPSNYMYKRQRWIKQQMRHVDLFEKE
ncbi:MAG: monofunctional biosynthetic peptidoglycan transglycosylase [Prevotellaceae bacterium]|nr:monofunctional biosynthetic peptidoglycan transglycosylase [Candidatus Colivivens equi]